MLLVGLSRGYKLVTRQGRAIQPTGGELHHVRQGRADQLNSDTARARAESGEILVRVRVSRREGGHGKWPYKANRCSRANRWPCWLLVTTR